MSKRKSKTVPTEATSRAVTAQPRKNWYEWLVVLPEKRFKALKRARLVKQKRLESELEKGYLKDKRKFNVAYNDFTEVLLADAERQRRAGVPNPTTYTGCECRL